MKRSSKSVIVALGTYLVFEVTKWFAFLADAQLTGLLLWMIWPAGLEYGLGNKFDLDPGQSVPHVALWVLGVAVAVATGWIYERLSRDDRPGTDLNVVLVSAATLSALVATSWIVYAIGRATGVGRMLE